MHKTKQARDFLSKIRENAAKEKLEREKNEQFQKEHMINIASEPEKQKETSESETDTTGNLEPPPMMTQTESKTKHQQIDKEEKQKELSNLTIWEKLLANEKSLSLEHMVPSLFHKKNERRKRALLFTEKSLNHARTQTGGFTSA